MDLLQKLSNNGTIKRVLSGNPLKRLKPDFDSSIFFMVWHNAPLVFDIDKRCKACCE
jgi:hypothetical protein